MSDRELKELIASLAQEHKKNRGCPAEDSGRSVEFQENMEAGMRELRKELSGVGRTQGEIAEDLFRRNLMKALAYRGILLDRP